MADLLSEKHRHVPAGDHTLKQRLELLQAHRDDVINRMEEMQRYLDKVNWKIDFYNEKLREYENRKEAQE